MGWVRITEEAPADRGYEPGEVVNLGSNSAIWKQRGWAKPASAPEYETAARRTQSPAGRDRVCGAKLSSGGRCSRETDGGRCWQHEEAS